MRRCTSVITLLPWLAACSTEVLSLGADAAPDVRRVAADGGQADAGQADAGAIGEPIRVRVWTLEVDALGQREVPTDTTLWQALVYRDGREVARGRGSLDGRFEGLSAEPGRRMVVLSTPQRQHFVIDGASSTIELMDTVVGRDHVPSAAQTSLELWLRGLAPWVDGDILGLFPDTAPPPLFLGPGVYVEPPPPRSTALERRRIDWTGRPLLRGRPQDDLVVARYASIPSSDWRRLTELGMLENVALRDGANHAVSTPMQRVTADVDVPVVFGESPLTAAELDPRAESLSVSLAVAQHIPGTRSFRVGLDRGAIPLVYAESPDTRPRRLSERIARPMPRWEVRATYAVRYVVPSGTPGEGFDSALTAGQSVPLEEAIALGQLGLVLTPPRSPTIDGRSATQVLRGVGDSPTIAWTAPARGQPDGYVISLLALPPATPSSGSTRIFTDATSVTMPPGLLGAGDYLGTIEAVRGIADVARRPPLDGTPRSAWASVVIDRFGP